MEAILENCCGLDVHRDSVVACLLTGNLDDRPKKEIRTFFTMSKGLHELAAWLQATSCTHVAMESTGVYWKPVYHVLEESCEIKLANAQRIKNVPGRKTDISDVLESAGIKLGSVISDVFGVTGRSLLKQLMDNGKLDEETIRLLVKGQIKNKIPQLMDALDNLNPKIRATRLLRQLESLGYHVQIGSNSDVS